MQTPILICFLVAAATASTVWSPNVELRYQLKVRELVGQPEIEKTFAGHLLKAEVLVQAHSRNTLVVQFDNVKAVAGLKDLPGGWLQHQISGWDTPGPVSSELKAASPSKITKVLSKAVIKINLDNQGKVKSFEVSASRKPEEVNIFRALVSALQINVKPPRDHSGSNTIETLKSSTYYKTMEELITGECRQLYEFIPLSAEIVASKPWLIPSPKYCPVNKYWEIIKTSNYSDCEERPSYHFGFPEKIQNEPGSAAVGTFWTRNAVARYTACGEGENLFIQTIRSTNQIAVNPLISKSEKSVVRTSKNFTLIDAGVIHSKIQLPSNLRKYDSLVYDYIEASDLSSSQISKSNVQVPRKYQSFSSSKYSSPYDAPYSFLDDLDDSDESSESDSDSDEDEDNWQPTPTLTKPALNPMLPFFVGLEGHSIKSKVNAPGKLIQLIKDIAEDSMDPSSMPEKNTLNKVQIATRLMRVLNLNELKVVSQQLFEVGYPQSRKLQAAKKFFRDILAMAGTNPAFMLTKTLILSNQLKGVKAALMISSFPKTLRTPTVELLKEWLDLCNKLQASKSRQLRMSCVVSLARLVNNVCVNPNKRVNRYPVNAFGSFCSPHQPFIVNTLIPYLEHKLNQTSDSRWQMTYARALAIIGHEASLPALESILEDDRDDVSDTVRAFTILSTEPIVKRNPKLMNKILMKIFQNTDDDYVVRSAAFVRLMNKDISLSTLQRIATSTWWEPNVQVENLIKSTIKSMAKQNVPEFLRPLRQKCAKVVHLLHPVLRGIQRSNTKYQSNYVKEWRAGLVTKTTWFGSDDSIYPKMFQHKVRKTFGGLNFTPLKITAMLSSASDWYDELDDILDDTDDDSSSSSQEDDSLADNVLKALNIESEEDEDLEGVLNVKINNAMDFFVPFNNETLQEIVQYIRSHEKELEHEQEFNFQKVINRGQIVQAVVSGMGFPVVFTLNTPTYVTVRGQMLVDAQPDLNSAHEGELNVPDKVIAKGKIEISVASTEIARLKVVDIINSQSYITGVDKEILGHLPVKFYVNADLEEEEYVVDITPSPKQSEFNLFYYNVDPMTGVKDIDDLTPLPDVKRVEMLEVRDKPLEKSVTVGKKFTGLDLVIEQSTDGEFLDLESYMKIIRKKSLAGLLHLPLLSGSVRSTELSVTLNVDKSSTKSIKIAVDHDEDDTPNPKFQGGNPVSLESGDSSDSDESFEQFGKHEFSWNDHHFKLHEDLDSSESDSNSDSIESNEIYQPNRVSSKFQRGSRWSSSVELHKSQVPTWIKWSNPYQKYPIKMEHHSDEWSPSARASIWSEERQKLVLRKLLDGTKASEADLLDVYIGFRSNEGTRHYSLTIGTTEALTDEDNDRYAVYAKRSAVPGQYSPMEICLKAQENSASLPIFDLEEVLKDDPKSTLRASVAYGPTCSSGTKIDLKAIMRQSPERESFVDKSPVAKQCRKEMSQGYELSYSCRNATYSAGITDEFLVTLEVDQIHKPISNFTRKLIDLAQSYVPYQTSVTHLDLLGASNPSKKIQVHGKFHKDLKGGTVRVSTMDRNILFQNLRIPHVLRPVLPYHPTYDVVDRYMTKVTNLQYTPYCFTDDDKVTTFDNVTYKYDLGDKYHLLVADTSEDGEDVAVLAKDGVNDNKVLLVYSDDLHIKVTSEADDVDSADDFDVFINGQSVDINEEDMYVKEDKDGEDILYIYALEGGVLVVELPDKDIMVVHNGESLAVSFDNSYRDDVSGLCGNFDGEPVGEFETASGCVVSDPQVFASSYALRISPYSQTRMVPEAIRQRSSCSQKLRTKSDAFSTWDSYYVSKCMIQERKVIFRGDQPCISQVPITECGSQCSPTYMSTKQIPFVCIPRQVIPPKATLSSIIHNSNVLSIVERSQPSFHRSLYVPQGCSPRY